MLHLIAQNTDRQTNLAGRMKLQNLQIVPSLAGQAIVSAGDENYVAAAAAATEANFWGLNSQGLEIGQLCRYFVFVVVVFSSS